MKIRCVENSIRYRLRKSDIKKLHEQNFVSDRVGFGGEHVFKFTLKVGQKINLSADFIDGEIIIELPAVQFEKWANTSEVSIEENLKLENDKHLHVLIEKDFPCKDREEDISDTFFELNPDEAC